MSNLVKIILFNEIDQKVEYDSAKENKGAKVEYFELLPQIDKITERWENEGKFLVEEIQEDTYTLVRKFASIENGLEFSLIVCGNSIS